MSTEKYTSMPKVGGSQFKGLVKSMSKPTQSGTPMKEAMNVPVAWAIGVAPFVPTPMERHIEVGEHSEGKEHAVKENPAFTQSVNSAALGGAKDLAPFLGIIVGGWLVWKYFAQPALSGIQSSTTAVPAITDNLGTAALGTPTAVQIATAQQVATVQAIQAENATQGYATAAYGSATSAAGSAQQAASYASAAADQALQAANAAAAGQISAQQASAYLAQAQAAIAAAGLGTNDAAIVKLQTAVRILSGLSTIAPGIANSGAGGFFA